MTRDPIDYAGGTNLYSYCGNNPVSGADPWGTSDFFTGMFMGYMRFCLQMGNLTGNKDYTRAVNIMFPPDPCDGFNYDAPFIVASMVSPEGLEANAGRAVEAVEEAEETANVVKICENGHCFVAGTPVQMADGTTKPIEQVQDGDWVKSYNPQTRKAEAKQVLTTYQRWAPQIVTLTLGDSLTSGATEQFTCTPEHPFYVSGQGFVEAGQLRIGTQIVSRTGSQLTVKSRSPVMDKTTQFGYKSGLGYHVYNLKIADNHTYFVGVHDGGVCVHNADYELLNPSDLKPTHGLPNNLNYNKRVKRLIDDIKENGMKDPIKYVEHDGEKYIVDGHHRQWIGKHLKIQVPASRVELPYGNGYKTVEDLEWSPWNNW